MDALTYESMKMFLMGAISRVFHPGIKFEYMLCLVGGHGVRQMNTDQRREFTRLLFA